MCFTVLPQYPPDTCSLQRLASKQTDLQLPADLLVVLVHEALISRKHDVGAAARAAATPAAQLAPPHLLPSLSIATVADHLRRGQQAGDLSS